MNRWCILVLVLAVAGAAAAAPMQLKDLSLAKNGQTGTKDCGGGVATISGNENTLTLVNCSRVVVAGNENRVTLQGTTTLEVPGNKNSIDAGVVKSIGVMGNHNVVYFKLGPDGKKPSITNMGSRNKIRKSK